ncbi:MAG TPA: hypothetical protein VFE65_33495 [Pseudonocardia sp.]|jgi:hypothetical protein|nr:hypothetical protein [Pseudonocardia sp.]
MTGDLTEVPLAKVLYAVEQGLREDVLPAVSDEHAISALKSALRVIGIAGKQLVVDQRWHRSLVDRALPLSGGWEAGLREAAPSVADEVAQALRTAHSLIDDDAAGAREHLLLAARLGLTEVWRNPALRADGELLRSIRRVVRMDIEEHVAISR